MRLALPGVAGNANVGTEEHFGRDRRELRLMKEIMRAARSLWPQKTAAELAFRTNVSQRTAENWLSLSTGISGPALSALIASEEGLHFIEALIVAQGKGKPAYWRTFKRKQKRAQLREEIKRLQHEFDLADAAD
jgi:hypothetical protein